MRSTQKKGPRTPALIRARNTSGVEAMYAALQSAATTAAVVNAAWINSLRREPPEAEPTTQTTPRKPLAPAGGVSRPMALVRLHDGTVLIEIGDQSIAITAQEYRLLSRLTGEIRVYGGTSAAKPAAEITRQNRHIPKEPDMPSISPEDLQRQHHEIASMAAETAGRVACHSPYDRVFNGMLRPEAHSPAAAGKAVTDAYQAALKQLSEGAVPRAVTAAAGD